VEKDQTQQLCKHTALTDELFCDRRDREIAFTDHIIIILIIIIIIIIVRKVCSEN